MSENSDIQSSSISKGSSLKEIADYWDTHSLADHWEQTHEVDFEVRAPRRVILDPEVYGRLEEEARTRGVSLATLVNLWLSEHLSTDKAA
jgi:CopG antitoxin of type II toxin-antitoxin system